jgi:hypothetical protein
MLNLPEARLRSHAPPRRACARVRRPGAPALACDAQHPRADRPIPALIPARPLSHGARGVVGRIGPVGESALGISAATFTPARGGRHARSLTLEYYDTTGLGTFTRV